MSVICRDLSSDFSNKSPRLSTTSHFSSFLLRANLPQYVVACTFNRCCCLKRELLSAQLAMASASKQSNGSSNGTYPGFVAVAAVATINLKSISFLPLSVPPSLFPHNCSRNLQEGGKWTGEFFRRCRKFCRLPSHLAQANE